MGKQHAEHTAKEHGHIELNIAGKKYAFSSSLAFDSSLTDYSISLQVSSLNDSMTCEICCEQQHG